MGQAKRAMSVLIPPVGHQHATFGMHTRFGRTKAANPKGLSSIVAAAKVPIYSIAFLSAATPWYQSKEDEQGLSK